MSPRPSTARARPGITLTEILISILIMGIGLISLATLFPLGLVRLRDAARQSRSGLLAETAIGDTGAKNLLAKPLFLQSYYAFDPFLVDVDVVGNPTYNAAVATNVSWTGGGLPVCYDPLWRSVTQISPLIYPSTPARNAAIYEVNQAEARFGAGVIGNDRNLRADPTAAGTPSAHGLQRITNFVPWTLGLNWELTYNRAGANVPFTLRDLAVETFVSPEDIVMQNSEPNQTVLNIDPNTTGNASSIVPEFFRSANGGTEIRSDFNYTWFFTGRQVDATNNSVFEGDVVVCHNRPFGLDSILFAPTGGTKSVASGETTIEGIFGYGVTPDNSTLANGVGYASAADRTVLIRWPAGLADPEIKVGSWIADVTYERFQATANARASFYGAPRDRPRYPMQRCHWYQVSKRGEPEDDPNVGGFRRLIVTTNSPLKSRTLLRFGTGVSAPVYLNAVLFMPSVVNVFSKTFFSR